MLTLIFDIALHTLVVTWAQEGLSLRVHYATIFVDSPTDDVKEKHWESHLVLLYHEYWCDGGTTFSYQLFVFSGFCFLEVVQMLTVPHSRPLCKTFETQAW